MSVFSLTPELFNQKISANIVEIDKLQAEITKICSMYDKIFPFQEKEINKLQKEISCLVEQNKELRIRIETPDHKNYKEAQEFICDQLAKELKRLAGFEILGPCDSIVCNIEEDDIIIADDSISYRLNLSEAGSMLGLKDYEVGINVWAYADYVLNTTAMELLKSCIDNLETDLGCMDRAYIDSDKKKLTKKMKYDKYLREQFLPFMKKS